MSEESIEKYYEIIRKCARDHENLVISNGSEKHASYLIKTLLENARQKMCIFTGELYAGVYNEKGLVQAAVNFLRRSEDCGLEIIFQDKSIDLEAVTQKHQLIHQVISDPSRKGSLWIGRSSDKKLEGINHFTVMDDSAFRYEIDHDKRKAIANFGDHESANKLADLFAVIKKMATPVPLPMLSVME